MKLHEIKDIKFVYNLISYSSVFLLALFIAFGDRNIIHILILSTFIVVSFLLKISQFNLKKRRKRKLRLHQKKLSLFLKNAEKISIDLSDAEITTRNYKEKILVQGSGTYKEHYETIEVTDNEVTIKMTENDMTLSFVIECNEDDLAIAFALKKTTYFYFDPNNLQESYYLDLEFLKDLHSETSPARIYRPVYLTHQSLQHFSWTYFDELGPSISNHRLD